MSPKPTNPAKPARPADELDPAELKFARDLARVFTKHAVERVSSIRLGAPATTTAFMAPPISCSPPKRPVLVSYKKDGRSISVWICQ